VDANDQNLMIIQEFEQKLNRKLTAQELNFVKWMVKKNQYKMEGLKDASSNVTNLEQWYRKKYHIPFS
jgi:hypothetical protein